jgi:hypothetical protein
MCFLKWDKELNDSQQTGHTQESREPWSASLWRNWIEETSRRWGEVAELWNLLRRVDRLEEEEEEDGDEASDEEGKVPPPTDDPPPQYNGLNQSTS